MNICHELGSVKIVEQVLIECGGFIKGKPHFCDENCYNKWLENNKKAIVNT